MKIFYTAALLGILTMGTALYAQSSYPTVECDANHHLVTMPSGIQACIPPGNPK